MKTQTIDLGHGLLRLTARHNVAGPYLQLETFIPPDTDDSIYHPPTYTSAVLTLERVRQLAATFHNMLGSDPIAPLIGTHRAKVTP